jgi:hypothetical protein
MRTASLLGRKIEGIHPDDPLIELVCSTCQRETLHALTSMGLKCVSCEELFFAAAAIPPLPSETLPSTASGVVRS